jgi:hypothetical protein
MLCIKGVMEQHVVKLGPLKLKMLHYLGITAQQS